MSFRANDGYVEWSDTGDIWLTVDPIRMREVYAIGGAPADAVEELEAAIAAAQFQREHGEI